MSNDKKAIDSYLKGLENESQVATVDLKTFDGSNDKYTIKLTDHKANTFKKVKREAFIILFKRHILFLEKGRGKHIFSTHFLNLKELRIPDDPTKNIIISFYGKGEFGDTNNGTTNPSVQPNEYISLMFGVLQNESRQVLVNSLYGFFVNTFPACPPFFDPRFCQIPQSMIQIQKQTQEANEQGKRKDIVAGGYLNAYLAMCEWAGEPVSKELIWDLRRIYNSKKCTNFNTQFMSKHKYSAKTLMPVFSVLGMNNFFTTLHITGLHIDRDISNCIGWMFRHNKTLTDISFVKCDLNGDSLKSIVDPFSSGQAGMPLTSLDISSNPLDDKGLNCVSTILKYDKLRLTKLKLADCNAGNSGLSSIITGFKRNPGLVASLKEVDLSQNNFSNESIAKDLSNELSKGKLVKLVLRSTKLNFMAFSKNKFDVPEMDFSGNPNLTKTDNLNGLNTLLNGSPAITKISIANCGLVAENIDYLWKGTNRMNKLEELDVSDNDSLGISGVALLIKKIISNKALKKLNISNCFDKDQKHMDDLVSALKEYSSLKHFPTHIKMAGGSHPLGNGLLKFLLTLVDNKRLEYIDISGHNLGDDAALMVSRLLQNNRTMKGIDFDRNGVTLKGLEEISKQIVPGITLTKISLPIIDISSQLEILSKSTDKERLKDVSLEIEEKLSAYSRFNSNKELSAAAEGDASQRTAEGARSPTLGPPTPLISTGKDLPTVSTPKKPEQKSTVKTPMKIQNVDYLAKKYPEIEDVMPADDDLLLSTGLFPQLSNALLYSEDI